MYLFYVSMDKFVTHVFESVYCTQDYALQSRSTGQKINKDTE